jgi:uncharacterized protein (DUF1330 family)
MGIPYIVIIPDGKKCKPVDGDGSFTAGCCLKAALFSVTCIKPGCIRTISTEYVVNGSQEALMSVHVIIDIKVLNADMYDEYIRKVPPIIKKFGGRYLSRGGEITVLEGNWHPERIILLEFDNAGQVNTWINSSEYAEVASLRENSTMANAIMLESDVLPEA